MESVIGPGGVAWEAISGASSASRWPVRVTLTETMRLGAAGTSVVPSSCVTLRVAAEPAAGLPDAAGPADAESPPAPELQAVRPRTAVTAAAADTAQRRRIEVLMCTSGESVRLVQRILGQAYLN
ncbi:hypothetical protein GCM10014719_24330 [Planomonospora parontospora subsp. antibiotica]|nr:hypothetical protein GCM10014719_24330 [Planomonospora parontospora subsp. antibiotica]GII15790.1 hypothetical protein Ppa05_25160 [Planomonospora parontospora subsp. antibiotica]